jgi:flagellar hook assembly protein FlgD
LQGKTIKIIDNSKQNLRVGLNEYIWDGTDLLGNKLPVGVYYYRFSLGNKGVNLSLENGKLIRL